MPKGDGSATILPTLNHYTFTLAKERNSAVGPFLSGAPQPFSAMERYLWGRYDLTTHVLEKQQGKGKRG